jgi:hypothetical protein
MTTPTEQFLTARCVDIDTRLAEIKAETDALAAKAAELTTEAKGLRRERSANMQSLGIPVRPRKAKEAKADE